MKNQFREPWAQSNFFYDRTDPWPGVPLVPVRNKLKKDFWEGLAEMCKALFWFTLMCLAFAMIQIWVTK